MLVDFWSVDLRNGLFPDQLLRLRMNVQIHSGLGNWEHYDHSHTSQHLLPSRGQKVDAANNASLSLSLEAELVGEGYLKAGEGTLNGNTFALCLKLVCFLRDSADLGVSSCHA
jgi:hypothetical protein